VHQRHKRKLRVKGNQRLRRGRALSTQVGISRVRMSRSQINLPLLPRIRPLHNTP
jgi:hypothetical protein